MSVTRRVLSEAPDPYDPKRKIYLLTCGHRVSRRRGGRAKAWCHCGFCHEYPTTREILADTHYIDKQWEKEVARAYAEAAGK
jgi:hypothetical protein